MLANQVLNKHIDLERRLSVKRIRRLKQGLKKAKTFFEFLSLYELILLIIRHYPDDSDALEPMLAVIMSKMNSLD